MVKRTREQVRKAILEILSDGKNHSYGDLERKADTNWQTIRDHCRELEMFGALTIGKDGVMISEAGRDVLKKLGKRKG